MSSAQFDSINTLIPVLKTRYLDSNFTVLTPKLTPIYSTIRKFTDWDGYDLPVPMRYANASGISNDFKYAEANARAVPYAKFSLLRKEIFGVHVIQGQALAAAASNRGSFIMERTSAIDSIFQGLALKTESDITRTGTGSLGQIATSGGLSSNTITFQNVEDIMNFDVGMTLVASATDGATPRAGQEVVGAINTRNGYNTITSLDATWATGIPTIANGDFLSRQGDTNICVTGMGAWIPKTPPTSALFFGLDRTVSNKLYGEAYDATSSGVSHEEAIIQAERLVARHGFPADTVYMNNKDFAILRMSAGSRIFYPREGGAKMSIPRIARPESDETYKNFKKRKNDVDRDMEGNLFADMSFSDVAIAGEYGKMDIIPSPRCPQGTAFVTQRNTWIFASLGEYPTFMDEDGLEMLRMTGANAYQMRIGGYAELYTTTPIATCNVSLPIIN